MNKEYDSHRYDDIIHLPHPVSTRHPQMPVADRAAQFSPFAALTGHEEAVKETARLTDRRIELDEYEKAELNEKISMLAARPDRKEEVEITYFLPDEKKAGGAYVTVRGVVKKFREFEHEILMESGEVIPIGEILELHGVTI